MRGEDQLRITDLLQSQSQHTRRVSEAQAQPQTDANERMQEQTMIKRIP